MTTNETGWVKTHSNEAIKQYVTYSGGNIQYVYECRANTDDGDPCIRTEYVYNGSNQMTKMKETLDTWLAAYDI